MTDTLDRIRVSVSRLLLGLVWLQLPIAGVAAAALGHAWLPVAMSAGGIAGVATLMWWRDAAGKPTRLTIGVALIANLSMILAACAGAEYQLDLHMAYFAELAILTAYCDRDVVLAGAGVTALHHLALNFLMPALVFPDGNQFSRVVLHAGILVVEAAALIWLTQRIVTLFAVATANMSAIMAASDQARLAESAAAEQRRLHEAAQQEAATERANLAAEQAMVVSEVGAGLQSLAAGDLSRRLRAAFPPRCEELRENFNAAIAQLEQLLRAVVGNTRAVRSGTGEILVACTDLSQRTEQQAANLAETAVALGEISATVHQTAEGAKQALAVVSRAQEDGDRSGEVVRRAMLAMAAIEDSSRQVARIIGAIDEIAFQTSLLALNAGVEAARAGDAGRGFAVVASEVRSLAQRSADSAREIKALVGNSSDQVGAGVKLVQQTGDALARGVAQVSEITSLVTSIALSARGQSVALTEVSKAVNQVDQTVQQNAAMVEETTAAFHSLVKQTEALAQMTEHFHLGAGRGGEDRPSGQHSAAA